MNNITELLEKSKKNSIGIDKKSYKEGLKNISKKTLLISLSLLMSLSFVACSELKKDVVEYESVTNTIVQEDYSNLFNKTQDELDYIEGLERIPVEVMRVDELLKENVIYEDSEIDNKYKQIKNLTEDDLLGLYRLLGKAECEKVVQALGYQNWDDYFIKNNCVDEKGEPQLSIWFERECIRLGRELREWRENKNDVENSITR